MEWARRRARRLWRAAVWAVVALAPLACACTTESRPLPGQEGCVAFACHGRVETIHYGGAQLSCVDCHGGDPNATTKATAHPTTSVSFNAATPGTHLPGGRLLADAPLEELDELDPDILQFLNPADYRVVRRTCGSATRGGGNCHTRIADTSLLSTHATLSGQLAGGLYFGGLTDRSARWSVHATDDPYPVDVQGTVASLDLLPDDVSEMPDGGDVERGYFASMGQLCVGCHLARDGAMVPGNYTSSGCDACHLLTDDDARPRTADPTQDPEELGHGALHRLTNLIPDSQCNRCHHAHLHRGLLAQGVRERSEPDGDRAIDGPNRGVEDPENAVYWPEENYVRYQGGYDLYGKPFPFYIEDEDGTNDVDETPPDIHTEKGLACIDCHTMQELHGGDHMSVRREYETQVRCQTCHGTPDDAIRPTDVPFVVARSRVGGTADNERVIDRDEDGALRQLGKLDGVLHPLTQIAERADPEQERFNPRVLMGCGLHAGSADFRAVLAEWVAGTDPSMVSETFPGLPDGATLADDVGTRPGRVECYTCHNAWTVNCYGCHVVRDDRQMATDRVTGRQYPGRVTNYAMSVLSDALALGFDTRGRVSPMVGTAIFFTHIDAGGETLVDAQPLRTVDGFMGDGNEHNPVHHHTVRRQPRDCQGCHPRADGVADDLSALARAVGYGTGEYVFIDGDGVRHYLDRLVAIDFDGDGEWDDPGADPLGFDAQAVAPVAASTHMSVAQEAGAPGPGPLDRETINRLLHNPVVPQREP